MGLAGCYWFSLVVFFNRASLFCSFFLCQSPSVLLCKQLAGSAQIDRSSSPWLHLLFSLQSEMHLPMIKSALFLKPWFAKLVPLAVNREPNCWLFSEQVSSGVVVSLSLEPIIDLCWCCCQNLHTNTICTKSTRKWFSDKTEKIAFQLSYKVKKVLLDSFLKHWKI